MTMDVVWASLNRIAYAVADHVEEAMRLWNQYVDEVGVEQLEQSAPVELRRFLTSVYLAENELRVNYDDEIESAQLSLLERY